MFYFYFLLFYLLMCGISFPIIFGVWNAYAQHEWPNLHKCDPNKEWFDCLGFSANISICGFIGVFVIIVMTGFGVRGFTFKKYKGK